MLQKRYSSLINYDAKNQITTYFVWFLISRKKEKKNSNKNITAQQKRVSNDPKTNYTMLNQCELIMEALDEFAVGTSNQYKINLLASRALKSSISLYTLYSLFENNEYIYNLVLIGVIPYML